MTPLLNPVGHREQLYNESHIRTRNAVERLIGVWKRRFPILAYGCRLKLDELYLMIIVATGVIHNICKDNNEDEPPDPQDIERFLEVMVADEVPHIPAIQDGRLMGVQTRVNLINQYFADLGE